MDLRARNPSNPAADTQNSQLRREEDQVTPHEAAQRKALNRLPLVWDTGWTPRRMQEYAAATNDINPDDLDNAITHLIRTSKFRPTPADIREAANPAKETIAVGRQIELDPEYQKPGPDGIRPFIHHAIQRVQRIGGPHATTYLHDLTTNRTQLTPEETQLITKHVERWAMEDAGLLAYAKQLGIRDTDAMMDAEYDNAPPAWSRAETAATEGIPDAPPVNMTDEHQEAQA